MPWERGQAIVRREMLRTGPWLGTVVFVVEDRPDLLVSYLPEGAPFGFPDGNWPTADGRHPWHGRSAWQGHGNVVKLLLARGADSRIRNNDGQTPLINEQKRYYGRQR